MGHLGDGTGNIQMNIHMIVINNIYSALKHSEGLKNN